MKNNGRLIVGGFLTLLGSALIIVSFFGFLFLLIYGVPFFVIGIFIFFNKKEDKIELRKDIKTGKTKK